MAKGGKLIAAIPEIPKSADAGLRVFLTAMKEAVEVRLGRRGDPLDEGVTKRDLLESGIAKRGTGGGSDLEPIVVEPDEGRIVPPVPVGFTAIPVFGGVHLTWENPFGAYNVHAFTELWRGESNDLSKAILINSSRGGTYFDRIPEEDGIEYWYWIRFISEYDKSGPFSLPVSARKAPDVDKIMEQISGEIDESHLTQAFKNDLGQMRSSYVVKLVNNSYVAGFGLYNSGTSSDFAVLADRFWVGSPATGRTKPFIIQNGTVYIDTAMIRDASIQSGKLGPISFGKIVDTQGNPVTTLAGKLRADAIDVTTLKVTDANISGVLRSSQVASNGQPRWMLDKNGGFTMNGSGAGGRLEIRDDVIKVFDSVGRLRVQIGNLAG